MTDVFIVGGGPAGLACAIALRQRGLTVQLVDSLRPPIDKTCGEGIMPEGVAALRQLGVSLSAEEAFTVRGIRMTGGGVSVESRFPGGTGAGVRRTVLHERLLRCAEECGVALRWGRSVQDLDAVESRWLVGADGSSSRVRKWAGLERFARDTRRFGFTRHYRMQPWSEYIEGHYGDGFQLFVTPLGREEAGLAVLSRDPSMRLADALERLPEVRGRLGAAEAITAERGGATYSRRLRSVTRGRVALIGDAAGSVDAVTADGLTSGFREALALAEAITRDDAAFYETAHRRIARRPGMMAALMLSMDRSAWVRRSSFRTMARQPALFRALLALHVGSAA